MKKKNHFIAYMIAIMIMLFSLPVKAQKVGYAQWDSTNKTLTFSGGGSVPDGLIRSVNIYLNGMTKTLL